MIVPFIYSVYYKNKKIGSYTCIYPLMGKFFYIEAPHYSWLKEPYKRVNYENIKLNLILKLLPETYCPITTYRTNLYELVIDLSKKSKRQIKLLKQNPNFYFD